MNNLTVEQIKQVEIEENGLIDFQFAILDAMERQGLSNADLALLLGVSRARVSQLLSSTANPTLKLATRALATLGLSATYVDRAQPLERGRKSTRASRGSLLKDMAAQSSEFERLWGRTSYNHQNENNVPHDREAA